LNSNFDINNQDFESIFAEIDCAKANDSNQEKTNVLIENPVLENTCFEESIQLFQFPNTDQIPRLKMSVGDSDSSNSLDSFEANNEVEPLTNKRKLSQAAGRIGANKRLSTSSTVSSGSGQTARFGNKVVEKGTNEYDSRRTKNNEAVKKCRQKNIEQQKNREEKLQSLTQENKELSNKVESLSKELDLLKNLFFNINKTTQLPFEIETRIKSLEEWKEKNKTLLNSS
jgi:hypothetical protein